jgi:hypothetical protein
MEAENEDIQRVGKDGKGTKDFETAKLCFLLGAFRIFASPIFRNLQTMHRIAAK